MASEAGDLIELITGAAINPNGWHDVLAHMAELIPGTKIMLAAGDAQLIGNAGLIYTGFRACLNALLRPDPICTP